MAASKPVMKRIVSLVVVALLVGGGRPGATSTRRAAGAPPSTGPRRVERGPLTAAVSATGKPQRRHDGPGRQPGLRTDQGAHGRLQLDRQEEPGHRADRPRTSSRPRSTRPRPTWTRRSATVLNQEAQVERARADVENARAALVEAKANTAKAQVTVVDSQARLRPQDASCSRRELIAKSDLDTSQATYDSAAAAQLDSTRAPRSRRWRPPSSRPIAQLRVRAGHARVGAGPGQAEGRRAQAGAGRPRPHDHPAPVDGVVVSRQVDVGQTVAASLQAPMLFTIAQDLTKMQVETSVDEADIGAHQARRSRDVHGRRVSRRDVHRGP